MPTQSGSLYRHSRNWGCQGCPPFGDLTPVISRILILNIDIDEPLEPLPPGCAFHPGDLAAFLANDLMASRLPVSSKTSSISPLMMMLLYSVTSSLYLSTSKLTCGSFRARLDFLPSLGEWMKIA